jgi:adenylate cyclase
MSDPSIIEQLRAYLPPDRAESVLQGEALAPSTFGAVMFADISGFTPLTEAVMRRYGARRGGEEFTNRLNAVYTSMVQQIDRYGGSIIGFAGDAMTVWFAADDGGRATATGFAMQAAMADCGRFVWDDGEAIRLSMKVAVSSGTLKRFQAGDPAIYLLDVLAGSAMERLAASEGMAEPGEVVVDGRTAGFLGSRLVIDSWRETPAGTLPERVAVASDLLDAPAPVALSRGPVPADAAERLRRWLIPEVARRVIAGQNIFLTELRPAAALFLRFGGLDFDADPEAPDKLDRYIRWVQQVFAGLEGTLLQLSIGEKGNYLYAAWGAPVAHDDDSRRSLQAALEIQHPPADLAAVVGEVEIGIAGGTMRTGAYGSQTRRTYGVLGDDTNLAARLMSKAARGTTLVSESVARRHLDTFELEALEPMKVKGKSEPIVAYRLRGRRMRGLLASLRSAIRAGPLIGRQTELAAIRAELAKVAAGEGQLVAIEAEAGTGKTRLLAEVVDDASRTFAIFAGDCPVLAREASYAVWTPIWRDFFGLKGEESAANVLRHLESYLAGVNPLLPERAPLLGAVLGVVLPDNDLTRSFDAKLRRSSLEGLLIECVRHAAARQPLLFILEECHWMDDASRHLLRLMTQAIARSPVGLLLAHRAVEAEAILSLEETGLPYVHQLKLGDLPDVDARALVALKLQDVFAGRAASPPAALVDLIVARAEGNPFFIEEVANLLKLREVSGDVARGPRDPRAAG